MSLCESCRFSDSASFLVSIGLLGTFVATQLTTSLCLSLSFGFSGSFRRICFIVRTADALPQPCKTLLSLQSVFPPIFWWSICLPLIVLFDDTTTGLDLLTMSWKLAEMRWRDEIGLNERCRVKAGMYQKDDITMNTTEVQRAHRGRSYTSPWCREMLGGNRLEYPTNEKRRPDPMLLAPVEVLDSSTTPLLRRTKSATRTSIDRVLPAHINAQHMTETETALLQTPLRPVSFRATPNLRPYVEGVKTTSRLQEGS